MLYVYTDTLTEMQKYCAEFVDIFGVREGSSAVINYMHNNDVMVRYKVAQFYRAGKTCSFVERVTAVCIILSACSGLRRKITACLDWFELLYLHSEC